MKKLYFLAMAAIYPAMILNAQTFTNASANLPGTYHSGGVTGVIDMDSDGLDDIVVMDESTDLYVLYQQDDGSFVEASYGTVSGDAQWGMAVGDVDNDGHLDVLCGGYYDGVHIVNIDGPGSYQQIEYTASNGGADYDIFMQCCNLADINNDGWLDAFACHDDGQAHIYGNQGNGSLTPHNDWINLDISNTDDSGNYGSVWTDFDRDGDTDLFIAKCRQFINDPYDPRRTNVLMVNDGSGNYSDQAEARGLVNLQQSWTSDFADLDNDGDFDCLLTTHSNTIEVYMNDGNGYFTDMTNGSGVETSGMFMQAKFADFNNDGWLDLVHSGGEDGYYRNNGDWTWDYIANTFPYTDTMHSFGIGDLNHDGWLDLYASYGNIYVDPDNSHPDRLWINNGGNNNWISFDVNGTISNKDAAGAVVEITGPFGVQVREVRDGESYGITNTSFCHFGIGTSTSVTNLKVFCPSGLITSLDNPAINTFHSITETLCEELQATIIAEGPVQLCTGETVTLTVENAPGSFIWNNGSTSNSITVNGGAYHVTVYDNNGCSAVSNTIEVQMITNTPATITADGPNSYCEGTPTTLTASEGATYVWSNGSTSQSISVVESGDYSVTVTNICGDVSSTESISINVYDAPTAPVVNDVTLDTPGSATLNATGTNINWYDAEEAVTPIGTGNSFTTPWLGTTTSFWAEDLTIYGGETGDGGKLSVTEGEEGQYHINSNNYLIFDAQVDIIILDVRVFANGAGNRTFQVIDQNATVVAEATINVPDGESVVALNFEVAAGSGYGLRLTDANPQLWRDKNVDVPTPYEFPYDIDGLATIVTTSADNGGSNSDNYYYFFYDWHVTTPEFSCASPRTEATVTVVGIDELDAAINLNIYPNPADQQLIVEYRMLQNPVLQLNITDAVGKLVMSQSWSNNTSGLNKRILDLSKLAQGVYNIEFLSDGKTATRKLVIE